MAGTLIGLFPLFGWHKGTTAECCYFMKVMDDYYLVFLYFGTIITPALILVAFYAHIYRVILKQLRNIVTMNPENGTSTSGSTSGSTMLRMLGAQQKKEVKATQNLSIIVLFFMICWVPLYTINCVTAFCSTCKIPSIYMYPFIILSHVNSACNPLLYAYHLKDFRAALKSLLLNLFRHEQPVTLINYNGRPSIASNAFSTNYYCNSMKDRHHELSFREFSYPVRSSSKIHFKGEGFPAMSATTSTHISSIVPKSVSLVAAAASTGDSKKEILWRLSEIPSISAGDSDFENKIFAYKDDNGGDSSENSANVNSAFIDGAFDVISDDVFVDETSPMTTNHYRNSKNNNRHSDLDAISDNFNETNETAVISNIMNKCNLKDCLLSSSSPQLSKNVVIIDTTSELLSQTNAKRKFVRSFSEVGKETVNKVVNRRGSKFSLSGDYINSTPSKSIKISPFKGSVKDYLLNKHSDVSSDDNISLKCSKIRSNSSIYSFDNQSFSSS